VFAENRELFGVPLFGLQQNPHIVVGLGCSYGCDFCSVTHFFGRKHIRFFTSGRDLFQEMLRMEKRFRSNVIVFIGDDNFLLDLKRAEELRQCVVESGKVFKTMIFGSADRAIKFGPEKLAEMGVDTIWIGREGKFSGYGKNQGVDLAALLAELRRFGIKTILSSILLLDAHTKSNIGEDIDEHVACRPTFSQFAHYSPSPGTPLWDRMKEEGRLITGIPYEEMHAFKQPWFRHPEFSLIEAEQVQIEAYRRDFHELGPSLARYIAVEYEAWNYLKDSPKPHFRARAQSYAKNMWKYRVLLLVTETLAPSAAGRTMARQLRERIEGDFGPSRVHEQLMARTLHVTGRLREAYTSRYGDALQPRTRVVRYND
jgi:haloalkane dehalogenase